MKGFFFLFKSCIHLFKGTKNSHAAVSYGVNKTYNKTTNKRKSYPPSSPKRSQTMTQLPTKGKHHKLGKKYSKPTDLTIPVLKQQEKKHPNKSNILRGRKPEAGRGGEGRAGNRAVGSTGSKARGEHVGWETGGCECDKSRKGGDIVIGGP